MYIIPHRTSVLAWTEVSHPVKSVSTLLWLFSQTNAVCRLILNALFIQSKADSITADMRWRLGQTGHMSPTHQDTGWDSLSATSSLVCWADNSLITKIKIWSPCSLKTTTSSGAVQGAEIIWHLTRFAGKWIWIKTTTIGRRRHVWDRFWIKLCLQSKNPVDLSDSYVGKRFVFRPDTKILTTSVPKTCV